MRSVGRFAPTPSGRMHLGNLFSALLAWLSVRSQGGELVLRMEDLDTQRTNAGYASQLRRDLTWLGLTWDRETTPQSQRQEAYQAAFRLLEEMGLLYPCYCTRSRLHRIDAPHATDGVYVYDGRCRNRKPEEWAAFGRLPAWRVRVPDREVSLWDGVQGQYIENLARDCGDFVVRRADGVFVYQLAVVVDDARMGVTEVVRGSDLLSSTARQLYLYRLLGLQAPQFAHCPLLLAADGRRLSKRDGDQSLENLRAKYTAEEIVGKLAYAYGLQPEPAPRTPESLIPEFSWAKVPKEDVCLPEGLF